MISHSVTSDCENEKKTEALCMPYKVDHDKTEAVIMPFKDDHEGFLSNVFQCDKYWQNIDTWETLGMPDNSILHIFEKLDRKWQVFTI